MATYAYQTAGLTPPRNPAQLPTDNPTSVYMSAGLPPYSVLEKALADSIAIADTTSVRREAMLFLASAIAQAMGLTSGAASAASVTSGQATGHGLTSSL